MSQKNLFISEAQINKTEGYSMGESDIFETFTDDRGDLFQSLMSEYGRCKGKIYHDNVLDDNGNNLPIGYIFQKRQKYNDSNETFLMETWVTFHVKPPTKTIEYHYQSF